MITLLNKQRKFTINKERIIHTATVVMKELGYEYFDLSILLTNNKTIRFYNKTYRNKDVATDILSFPYYSLKPGQRIAPYGSSKSSKSDLMLSVDDEENIGDIMISVEYVNSILPLFNVSLEERLDTILIHGICHLLGYSHYDPENDKIMSALEKKLAKKLSLSYKECRPS